MKSWRYLSKHLEGSGRKLISDISDPIQGKILTNQERFPLMFRCQNEVIKIGKGSMARILIINTKLKFLDVHRVNKSYAKYL